MDRSIHDLEALMGGYRGGRTCSICTHPERAAIDAMLLSKASHRMIAERFCTLEHKLTGTSVGRHARAHLLPAPPGAEDAKAVAKLWSAKDTVREVLIKALADLELAREGKALHVASNLYAQVRGLIETNAKLDGQMHAVRSLRQTVNVYSALPAPVLKEMRERWPDCYAWIMETLRGQVETMRAVSPVEEEKDED